MPIQIHTKKLRPWQNDLADEIKVGMLNEMVDDFAREVTKGLGALNCRRHPDVMSHVTIVADRTETMVILKEFCCHEFEALVSLKLAR